MTYNFSLSQRSKFLTTVIPPVLTAPWPRRSQGHDYNPHTPGLNASLGYIKAVVQACVGAALATYPRYLYARVFYGRNPRQLLRCQHPVWNELSWWSCLNFNISISKWLWYHYGYQDDFLSSNTMYIMIYIFLAYLCQLLQYHDIM